MESQEKIKEENIKCDLFYLKNKINDYELPTSLNEFRKKVQSITGLEFNKLEDIIIIYKFKIKENNKEKIIEVKTDSEYNNMLKRLKEDQIKDHSIFIETDKIPTETSRQNPETFEEEIEYLIESELKAAGERIKNALSGNKKCHPSAQNQDIKTCFKCSKIIIGNIFKSVTDIDEKYFCEKCSYEQKDPVFIIP